ncbi:MAG: hypothetical protein JST48_12300 [Bacteroidetes bacterium]|nr:hypothetical protein [Bacteroidota bacterium]
MQSVVKYFALFMCLVYIMLGAAMASGSPLFNNISRKYTLALGCIMIVYGLFRGYRVFQKYFSSHE